ncbi:MAG TPA: AsmA family protein [Alphaproteobacteria bacterium]
MRRFFKWTGIVVGSLAALLVVFAGALYFFNWNLLRGTINARGSQTIGRAFAIDGDLKVDLDSWSPRVHAEGIRLDNPDWAKERHMVEIKTLDFRIDLRQLLIGRIVLPELTLDEPKIDLEKPDKDRKNWDLSSASPGGAVVNTTVPKKRTQIPVIGELVVNRGVIKYEDAPSKLSVTSEITTAVGTGGDDRRKMIRFQSKGTVENQPFTIDAAGGSLLILRDPSTKYPLDFELRAGATVFSAKGTMTDPVQMAGIDMQLDVKGDNLAHIFPFTAIPLPPTPDYEISGRLKKEGDVWAFEQFKGAVGHSDLNGDMQYDSRRERPDIKADLTSKLLDFKDLAGFIGAGPAKQDHPEADQSERVVPRVPIDIERLRAADLDVRFRAHQINAPGAPLDDMDTRFLLKDGLLTVDPLKFGVADGTIDGKLGLDGRKDVPQVTTDLAIRQLSLKRFLENTRFESLSSGRFGGRFQVAGSGKSLGDVLGAGDGRVTVSMSGGQISALMIHAAGLDVAKALVRALGTDKATALRCAAADFRLERGLMTSDIFDIDTELSNIYGTANIDFATEGLDVRIEGHPKKPSPFVARTPITVTGTLKHPKVGLAAGEIGVRGAAAAALAAALPPLAIIPFIELGVGKDSDCAELIRQAQAHSAQEAQSPEQKQLDEQQAEAPRQQTPPAKPPEPDRDRPR